MQRHADQSLSVIARPSQRLAKAIHKNIIKSCLAFLLVFFSLNAFANYCDRIIYCNECHQRHSCCIKHKKVKHKRRVSRCHYRNPNDHGCDTFNVSIYYVWPLRPACMMGCNIPGLPCNGGGGDGFEVVYTDDNDYNPDLATADDDAAFDPELNIDR